VGTSRQADVFFRSEIVDLEQKLLEATADKVINHAVCLYAGDPDTSATKLVPKLKTNHRWSCVSSELSWVEVSRLFLDHSTRVEVSRTTFLSSKCLKTGAEVSQSVLMPKCPVTVCSCSGGAYKSARTAHGPRAYIS